MANLCIKLHFFLLPIAKVCAQVYMFYEATLSKINLPVTLAHAVGLADLNSDDSIIGIGSYKPLKTILVIGCDVIYF